MCHVSLERVSAAVERDTVRALRMAAQGAGTMRELLMAKRKDCDGGIHFVGPFGSRAWKGAVVTNSAQAPRERRVLRFYAPHECDEHGVPLGWECCRTCGGSGEAKEVLTPAVDRRDPAFEVKYWSACPDCDSWGSLREAALAEKMCGPEWAVRAGGGDAEDTVPRCESCSHPMSEGTWEGEDHGDDFKRDLLRESASGGRRVAERNGIVHFSPCDEGCTHGGPVQVQVEGSHWERIGPMEGELRSVRDLLAEERDSRSVRALWRPVEVRRGMVAKRGFGEAFDPSNVVHVRPWDLRPENLAVLCLRCWAST